MKTFVIGCIVAALCLLMYYATKQRPSVEFINGTDQKIFVMLLLKEKTRNESVKFELRANRETYIALLKGEYILLYRTDKELTWKEKSIEIKDGSCCEFIEPAEGEVRFRCKS